MQHHAYYATKTCHNFLRMEGKTLNVVLLDYMQNQMRPSRSMFRVLSQMNSDNIERYITGDIVIFKLEISR